MAAAPVITAPVIRKNVPLILPAIGSVQPRATVTVRPQVGGKLAGFHFREGDFVKAGDLLFTIDPLPFEVAPARATAALDQAKTEAANATARQERYVKLDRNGSVSAELVEQIRTTAATTVSQVTAATGAVRQAQLELDYCRITAPLTGRAGRLLLDAGNIVQANLTDLAVINEIQPIEVSFTLAGRHLPALRQYHAPDTPPLEVTVTPEGSPALTETGTVAFIDNTVRASSGTTPLEKAFSTIPGIDSMTSSSALGRTSITIQFALSRDIDAAALDVQSAISSAARRLPPDLPSPPSFRKSNPADFPILFPVLTSDTLPLSKVDEFAQNIVIPRLSTIQGVAQVNAYGSQKYAVRVQLNPVVLAARSLTMTGLREALDAGNSNLPTGTLDGKEQTFTIESNGQLTNAAAYRALIIACRDGSPVRLEDVATVLNDVENDKSASWYGNTRTLSPAIDRQPGTSTVAVVDAIRAVLPEVKRQLPAALDLDLHIDRSEPIRESVHDVQLTLLLGIGLVVLVIFLFLRRAPATIIPSIAIPLSLVGTFCVMYLLDFSLNNLSLMALTLCVGFAVDDAIVVLENIVRHMEKGESAMNAALKGSKEIAFTVISMTISLAAVFLRVLFMGGILGRLFKEFAVTIGVTILVSGGSP